MTDCIFCKIVNGEIQSYALYEDDLVKAFLDITPVNEGHSLVIPKKHRENLFDVTDEELKRIVIVAKKVAIKCKENLHFDNCNLIQSSGKHAGQDVMHFHMHVVPRRENDGLNIWQGKQAKKPNFDEIAKELSL